MPVQIQLLSLAIGTCLGAGRRGAARTATALGLVLSLASIARADVFTVTSAGDPGAAGLSLRQAIQNANAIPNSVVQFDPSLNGSTITLTQGLIPITQPTAITGPGADKLTVSGGNASGVFYLNTANPSAPVTISGITVSGGKSLGASAVYSYNSSLVLENSVISGNTSLGTFQAPPGAVYARVSGGNDYYARMTHVTVKQNSMAPGYAAVGFEGFPGSISASIGYCTIENNGGGGVSLTLKARLEVQYSRISSQTATYGGAIRADRATALTIRNSTMTGNSSIKGGGALWLYDTPTLIVSSVISGNTAYGDGGAIMLTGDPSILVPPGTLTVSNSTISGNKAYDFGAGIDVVRASGVYIYGSLISNNSLSDFTTGANGGGLALQFVVGQTQVADSTFYNNFAYHSAGGIGIFDLGTGNNAEFTNVTVAHNGTFNGYSNGILGTGQPTVKNSIIAGNSNAYGDTHDLVGSFKVTYSLIKNASMATITGSSNITNGADPQLGPLAVNGGPTLTMLPAALSPVIDAGSSTSPTITIDQRGVPRLAGSRVDMGAVERQNPEIMIFRSGFD